MLVLHAGIHPGHEGAARGVARPNPGRGIRVAGGQSLSVWQLRQDPRRRAGRRRPLARRGSGREGPDMSRAVDAQGNVPGGTHRRRDYATRVTRPCLWALTVLLLSVGCQAAPSTSAPTAVRAATSAPAATREPV